MSRISINNEALEKYNKHFAISFQYLDRVQGQTFEDWEQGGLLVKMLETLRDYCGNTMQDNKGKNFKVYGTFPPHSKFKYPTHVPTNAKWATLHIQGKECLAGIVDENVFYVVFLDKNHEFWPSKKKHT